MHACALHAVDGTPQMRGANCGSEGAAVSQVLESIEERFWVINVDKEQSLVFVLCIGPPELTEITFCSRILGLWSCFLFMIRK